jgi:hypothetical protein
LEAVRDTAQTLFLQQLAIIQHRPDLRPSAVPAPLRALSARFRVVLADMLMLLSDRMAGQPELPLPDLPAALAELEKTVATHIPTVTDAGVAAQIRARLALYQGTVALAMELARQPVG